MRNIILYVGSIFLPDKSAGAQRALSLCKSFRDLNYKPVIVGMSSDLDKNSFVLSTESSCQGFACFSVPQPKSIPQWFHHTVSINEFCKVAEFYGTENIFAIVAMEYEAIPLLKLSRYCKRHGIHLIADAEEWYERSNLSFPINIAKNFDTFLRMNYVYPKKIKNMICISRFFYSYYSKTIKHRVYIPGTIDMDEEKWKSLPPYIPNPVLTIGYAGYPGLKFEKERLDWLIKACLDLNSEGIPCKLKIAGIDRAFIKNLKPELAVNDSCIHYLGKLDHRDCLEMIASCDFSAIVRENKRVTKAGFPTKFSESLGCGTPVITTASSNVSEYIDNNESGLLCIGFDEKAIKTSLKKASQISKGTLLEMHTRLRDISPLIYENFTPFLKSFLGDINE